MPSLFIGVGVVAFSIMSHLAAGSARSVIPNHKDLCSIIRAFKDGWKGMAGVFLANLGMLALLWLVDHNEQVAERAIILLSSPRAQAIIGIVVMLLGWLAHYFKQRCQGIYGSVEIVFGATTSILAVRHIGTTTFFMTLATFGGCVYVVARGFTNVREARQR